MATKGRTIWEVKKERQVTQGMLLDEAYIAVNWYALRSDGKLLKKLQTKNADGSARYDYGWKLADQRMIQDMDPTTALELMQARGFEVVSHTPNAAAPAQRKHAVRGRY